MGTKNIKRIVIDGWENILTGLGIKGRDKRLSASITWEKLEENDVDELYCQSDVAAKIVDELPSEAFREGYEITFDGDTKLKASIDSEIDNLEINQKAEEAWRLARMYGGAGIVFIPENIEDLVKPLTLDNVNNISSLLVLNRHELPYAEMDNDIRSRNFGRPKFYRIQPRSSGAIQSVVHHSRIVRFDGSYLPRQKYINNSYWYDSVLTRAKNAIMNYDAAHDGLSTTLQDFSIAKYKIKGLSAMIREGDDELVVKRMQLVNDTRSICRAVVLDAEGEDFDYQTRQLTGAPELLRSLSGRLVTSSNMPHTKILGESPSGLGATGDSETKDWYDYVASQQENYLKSKLKRILTVMFAQKKGPTAGVIPKNFDIKFKSLWQETEKEKAEVREIQSRVDVSYIQSGVVDPTEVAVNRFGSGKYSTETVLSEERDAEAPAETETTTEEGADKKTSETV